jgi:hypothetical protein
MKKTIGIILLASSFSFAQPIQVPQIEFSPKKYVCYKSVEALNVDGKLDESAWNRTEWTDDFADIEGSVKPTPRFRTRAKMLWDEKYFYIAAEISEPDVWGTLKNRDDIIFFDNDFEIFLDPDGNTHSYCEFEMNALNTVWDLLLIEPYRDINNAAVNGFDIKGLKSGVSINGTINQPGDKDNCWTVEVAFPWESFNEISELKLPPKDADQIRINFSRVEWKTEVVDGKTKKQINPATNKPYPEDNWVWSPQGVVNMHYPEMWGYVQFSNETAGGKKVSFIEQKEEAAKWLLRNVYYAEKNYFQKNGTFTNNINALGIELKPVKGYAVLLKIECTTNMFEASLVSEDGSQKITINNTGLTSISMLKK